MNRSIGNIVFYGSLLAILLSAVPFGTVSPVYKALLCGAVCVLAAVRVLHSAVDGTFRFAEPAILMPALGVLLICILQLLPLPYLATPAPLSYDPYETKIFIMSFATLIVVCELLYFYTDSRKRLKALIALAIVTGVVSALFGIFRETFLDSRWAALRDYFPPASQSYGQFMNRNHFALLMEMSTGLVLGLWLKGRLSGQAKLGLGCAAGLMVYAAINTSSRGGSIIPAAIFAFAIFIHIATKRSWSRTAVNANRSTKLKPWRKVVIASALCLITLGISVFAVAFIGGDEVVGRMEKLEDEVSENRMNRLAIWRSTMHLISDNPVIGVGFGAYPTAIPRYVGSGGGWAIQQAHNEYLEILANGGVIAFALFGVFGVMVFRRSLTVFRSYDHLRRASCFGALLGIFGVLIHSLVDFGLHIMVNALIFTVLIVIATTRISDERPAASEA